jgi:hypothetical protein
MSRVMADLGETLDDLRHPGQRPEVGAEPRGAGAGAQRLLDRRQLRRPELGLPPRAAGRLEPSAARLLPRVVPVMGGHSRHSQCPRHCALRLALREQSRRLEPTRFQRRKIPAQSNWSGHASTCDRTYEIR